MLDLMFKADDEVTWDDFIASQSVEIVKDILIDEIGPIVVTPAVIGPDGEIITPAVIDPLFHVNVRVLENPLVFYEADGTVTEVDVCAMLAQGAPGVEWIDPSLVSTPDRIWAGGMNYWTPTSPQGMQSVAPTI